MSSRFSECKQGWMPQFPSSAYTVWWSLTKRCTKCFTPSLFIAEALAERWHCGFLKGSWNCNHFPSLSSLFWMAFWLPVTSAAKRIFAPSFKTRSNFSSRGERHKHQLVSFLSRNMQCQTMKHQILCSWLRLISVIRKENPQCIWSRNCLNSESEQHGTKELDCLIQLQRFPDACSDISFLGEGESALKADSSTCFTSSRTLRTYKKSPRLQKAWFCPSEPDPCPDAVLMAAVLCV